MMARQFGLDRQCRPVQLGRFGPTLQFRNRGLVGGNYIAGKKESSGKYGAVTHEILQQLLNGEESLAEFPFGSFLHSVMYLIFNFCMLKYDWL